MCMPSADTLRERLRLSVFEIGVLRSVFGLKREEVTGELRRLRNEDFHDWYFSQIIFWL